MVSHSKCLVTTSVVQKTPIRRCVAIKSGSSKLDIPGFSRVTTEHLYGCHLENLSQHFF